MLTTNLFYGTQYPLVIYNTQPIIDIGFEFVYDDCGEEMLFDFPDYVSSYLRIYNDRLGRMIKEIELVRNENILVLNTTDTDFDDNGGYYYEVVYNMLGGYEQVIRFGPLTVK